MIRAAYPWRMLVLAVVLAAGLSSIRPAAMHAATDTVTSCDESALRNVIIGAAAGDTVTFTSDCTIYFDSVQRGGGPIIVANAVTIDGDGHAVVFDGRSATSFFKVTRSGTLALRGLTLRDGLSPGGGGAISNDQGTLTLTNVTLEGNSAPNNGGGAILSYGVADLTNVVLKGNSAHDGGAIDNGGTMMLKNSILRGNSASGGGGALFNNYGTLSLMITSLYANRAGAGGAISNGNGVLSIQGGTLSGNSAGMRGSYGFGGAIYSSSSGAAEVTITDATFSDNDATHGGGGGAITLGGGGLSLVNTTFTGNSAPTGGALETSSGTIARLSNSTFSGNSAAHDGGGIWANGPLTVTNSTFSGNKAVNGGGIYNYLLGAATSLDNSILANSDGGDCGGEALTDKGGNLVDDRSCGFSPDSAVTTASLKLGKLANNGGPTQTIALGIGSSAIGAGISSICNAYPVRGRDQRGFRRGTTRCDTGAYERVQKSNKRKPEKMKERTKAGRQSGTLREGEFREPAARRSGGTVQERDRSEQRRRTGPVPPLWQHAVRYGTGIVPAG
jgi:predicted outer membrane repeat protein